jgi:hypothetical protein
MKDLQDVSHKLHASALAYGAAPRSAKSMAHIIDEHLPAIQQNAEDAKRLRALQGEAVSGTFACPICGKELAHFHSAEDVCAWAAAQANRFLTSLGNPEVVIRTKELDERRTNDFRKRVADAEDMLRDAGHSYQAEFGRLVAKSAQTVDVEAIKNTIDGMLIVARLTRDDMTRDTFNNAADKLSRAIGDKTLICYFCS